MPVSDYCCPRPLCFQLASVPTRTSLVTENADFTIFWIWLMNCARSYQYRKRQPLAAEQLMTEGLTNRVSIHLDPA